MVWIVQSLNRVQLCDPMDCSMPGFPVLHHLPELAQIHVHRSGDVVWIHDIMSVCSSMDI